MNKFSLFLFAGLMTLSFGAAHAQPAQGLGFISPGQKSPIQIEADNGLEWHKKENVYIARGNARASSGDMNVTADELRGYYRGGEGSEGFELYKLEASGSVHITVGQNKVLADEAYYDLDQGAFVMTGKSMQLLSPTAKLTAHERIEFWQNKNLAVARGGAIVEQGKNRLAADAISAHFNAGGAADKLSIHRIDAVGNVKVQSDGNLASSDNATYDMQQGLATLKGNVKLTQGPNQLQGEYAEMNTKTGVSRLLGSKDGSQGMKRVRALVMPDRAKKAGTF